MRFDLVGMALCGAMIAWIGFSQANASPDTQETFKEDAVQEVLAPTPSAPGDTALPRALRIGAAEVVHQITGIDSINETSRWNVHGTDLGHMFRHKGALYMVFGDTYGPKNGAWRSSTMARLADPDPHAGFDFAQMISGPNGAAKELIRSAKVPSFEWTVIPTNGMSLGERMVLHYMSVRAWTSDGNWLVRQSGLAYSEDDGQTWRRSPSAVWPNGIGFEQVAFVDQGEMIYSFGIPQGRFGAVRLRRVPREAVFEPTAYNYWDGTDWVGDYRAAASVVPAPAGELSVAWSEVHQCWLMMYLDEAQGAIVLRTAPDLIGPWSDAQTAAHARDFPGLYAPYIVPGTEIGDEVYFAMSRWKPLYNVFLMRAPLMIEMPAIAATDNGTESLVK
jgi:hypothetical protein